MSPVDLGSAIINRTAVFFTPVGTLLAAAFFYLSRSLLVRTGKKIALASSAKGDEIAHYRKIADIDGQTDAESSSDDAEQSKPHPDIFETALDRLGGIDPSCVIVVGDTAHDAEAASKAKLSIIGVLCGGFPEDEVRAAGCFAIYRDPAQLLSEYEKSPIR